MNRFALLALLLPTLACELATPFGGPGFDRADGVTLETDSDTVVVALTHAILKGDGPKQDVFYEHVAKVEASLAEQPGFIGHSLRRVFFGDDAWTMSVWADEASMLEFVISDVHQAAISAGFDSLAEASFAHAVVPKSEIPISWERADEILAESENTYTAE